MAGLAFVFPGQGSQFVGMGRELYEKTFFGRYSFDRADSILGYPLSKIMFEGPEENLRRTRYTQPAILLVSYVLYHLLEKTRVSMVAGHSIGEFTAALVAGSLSFTEVLTVVKVRAEVMDAAPEGMMAAVVGLDEDRVGRICWEVVRDLGESVVPANFNAPKNVIVSGAPTAVKEVMRRAKESGAKLVKLLTVSGAFHSGLVADAYFPLQLSLGTVPFREARVPIYCNCDAVPVQSPKDISLALLNQLLSPVRWTELIRKMVQDGADEFVEVGPGEVLAGLIKRIAPGVKVRSINSLAKAEEFNGHPFNLDPD